MNRREFLKIAGLTLMALVLPKNTKQDDEKLLEVLGEKYRIEPEDAIVYRDIEWGTVWCSTQSGANWSIGESDSEGVLETGGPFPDEEWIV